MSTTNDLLAKGSADECKANFITNVTQLNNELFFGAIINAVLSWAWYNTFLDGYMVTLYQTARTQFACWKAQAPEEAAKSEGLWTKFSVLFDYTSWWNTQVIDF